LHRGILQAAKFGWVFEDTVLAHLKNRNSIRSKMAKTQNPQSLMKLTDLYSDYYIQKIYKAVITHYAEHGTPPIYENIIKSVGLAKSGITRYLPKMKAKGLIEIHGKGRKKIIYPQGLSAAISKLVKEKYHDVLTQEIDPPTQLAGDIQEQMGNSGKVS
jgi:hypothetical protein